MIARVVLFILLCQVLVADQIKMKNGSILIGQISKVDEKSISIVTDFAGELVIEMTKVDSHTRAVVDGVIKEVRSIQLVEDEKIEEDPWSRMLSLDLSRRLGNTEESSFASGFRFIYDRDFNRLKLYGRFIRTERAELVTVDERKLGLDFEKSFGDKQRNSWYTRVEYERDIIEDLSLRQTYGGGYGYYIFNKESLSLRMRLGVLYRQEDYFNDESQDSMALDLGFVYKQTIFDQVKWLTEVTYSPAFNAEGNYRIVHESSIEMPLLLKVDLTLRSGVEHTYNSLPSADRKDLDTRFFTRVEYRF